MVGCRNEALVDKLTTNKLDEYSELAISITEELEACATIRTSKYISTVSATAYFNPRKKPTDQLNCDPVGCHVTGTLFLTAEGANQPVEAKFISKSDSTNYVAGLVYYYVYFETAGTYPITTKISDIADTTQTNSYVYENDIVVTAPGYYPVMVDLSTVPASQTGTGWVATNRGITLDVSITSDDAEQVLTAGISSISLFNSIHDLELNDTVILGCLDDFTGDYTVDPTDATCFGAEYDPATATVERTVTARKITPNAWKLNPFITKGEKTEGWIPETQEVTIETTTIDGVEYGMAQVSDRYEEECEFNYVALPSNCDIVSGYFTQVNSPVAMKIDERQFIVLEDGVYLFNAEMVGETVLIRYAKTVEVTHYVGSTKAMKGRKAKMSRVRTLSDGTRQHFIFPKTLITSFPDTDGLEETTFAFTFQMFRDRFNKFFDMYETQE